VISWFQAFAFKWNLCRYSLGLQHQHQQKGSSGGGGGEPVRYQPVRYFPGITASLHWLVTGIGFLLSIWCSIATLKHGDVSWYMVLHQLIPLGGAVQDESPVDPL
jgi:hypothetical protein